MKTDFNARDKQIYKLCLHGLSYRKIGEKFNVTGERIRQIECRILRKLEYENVSSPYGKLSTRTINALKSAGINSLEHAKKLTDYYLLRIKGIGKVTLLEIRKSEIWNTAKS